MRTKDVQFIGYNKGSCEFFYMKTRPAQANTIMGTAEVVNRDFAIRRVIFTSTLDYLLEPVFLTIYVYGATGLLL